MKIHRLLASVLLVVIGIGTLTLVAPAAKAVAADEKVEDGNDGGEIFAR